MPFRCACNRHLPVFRFIITKCIFPKGIFAKCFFLKMYFSKCTQLLHLLSFQINLTNCSPDNFSVWQLFDRHVFATLWLLLLVPLIILEPSPACKIITNPVTWDDQLRPWNIFNQPTPKPTPPPTSSTTSYQPPSCTCGEQVGPGVKQHPWLVGKQYFFSIFFETIFITR